MGGGVGAGRCVPRTQGLLQLLPLRRSGAQQPSDQHSGVAIQVVGSCTPATLRARGGGSARLSAAAPCRGRGGAALFGPLLTVAGMAVQLCSAPC